MDDQVVVELLGALAARVGPGDHGDLVSPGDPARHLAVQVRARTPALRVGPVAIGQEKDVQPHDARPYRGCLRRTPTMTPVKRRLPTAAALLTALALGASASVALAQSAGDEQYADPLAKQTTPSAKPHATTSQSVEHCADRVGGTARRPDHLDVDLDVRYEQLLRHQWHAVVAAPHRPQRGAPGRRGRRARARRRRSAPAHDACAPPLTTSAARARATPRRPARDSRGVCARATSC